MAEDSNKVVSLRGEPVVTQEQEVDPKAALRAEVDELLESYKGKLTGVIVLSQGEDGGDVLQAAGDIAYLPKMVFHLESAKFALMSQSMHRISTIPPKS